MGTELLTSAVTPYAGVWIEIPLTFAIGYGNLVTPYAGVWIEILCRSYHQNPTEGHSLRGSVD